MGNRIAAYKHPHVHETFERWWYQVSLEDSQRFYEPDALFKSYTEHMMGLGDYRAIMGYEDFQRLIYREGVRRVGVTPTSPFLRAKHWRPSDESVMRYELGRAL